MNDMRVQSSGGSTPTKTDRERRPLETSEGVEQLEIDTGTTTRTSSNNSVFQCHSQEKGKPVTRLKLVTLGDKVTALGTLFETKLVPTISGSFKQDSFTKMLASTMTSERVVMMERHLSWTSPEGSDGDMKKRALALTREWLILTKSIRQSILDDDIF
jgi:hypothetical protein